MAAMVALEIDGRPVAAVPGQTVLEAALAAGVYIPHLCSHPALPSVGGCGMCVVEIVGPNDESVADPARPAVHPRRRMRRRPGPCSRA